MLETLVVRTFKSLEDVTVHLGLVNVFIGANGSGKSNLLEALGVLSAAADGKVGDQALLARGVRPGVPSLYKSAFPVTPGKKVPPHLYFGAYGSSANYEVSLHNPLKQPAPAWRFKTERWGTGNEKSSLVGRSPARDKNPERGLAALKAVDVADGPALDLLKLLQDYAIFSPTTSVLRGVSPESQPRQPVGLSGGDLPRAVFGLIRKGDAHNERISRDLMDMVDWADKIVVVSSAPASGSRFKTVIRFRDRFMRIDRGMLSAQDVSEGVLYALFLAVISGHKECPALCAVDNADHGLNPRFARSLMKNLCQWYMDADEPRQILMTTHNPLVLDGLPLQDDRVRLFTVSRTSSGRTSVRRVEINEGLLKQAKAGWTLSRLWVMGHLGGVPDV